jgi:hypothetical protein
MPVGCPGRKTVISSVTNSSYRVTVFKLSFDAELEIHTAKVIFSAQEAGKAQISRFFVESQSCPAAAFKDFNSVSYPISASHKPFCD